MISGSRCCSNCASLSCGSNGRASGRTASNCAAAAEDAFGEGRGNGLEAHHVHTCAESLDGRNQLISMVSRQIARACDLLVEILLPEHGAIVPS